MASGVAHFVLPSEHLTKMTWWCRLAALRTAPIVVYQSFMRMFCRNISFVDPESQ